MATKLQRKLLWQMIHADDRAVFVTGNKSTSWGDVLKIGPALIYCSEVVWFGLKANKFIEKETAEFGKDIKDKIWFITEVGIKAAGRTEPVMTVAHHGAHGIRWK